MASICSGGSLWDGALHLWGLHQLWVVSVKTELNCRTPHQDLQRMGKLVVVREKVTYLMSEVL